MRHDGCDGRCQHGKRRCPRSGHGSGERSTNVHLVAAFACPGIKLLFPQQILQGHRLSQQSPHESFMGERRAPPFLKASISKASVLPSIDVFRACDDVEDDVIGPISRQTREVATWILSSSEDACLVLLLKKIAQTSEEGLGQVSRSCPTPGAFRSQGNGRPLVLVSSGWISPDSAGIEQ